MHWLGWLFRRHRRVRLPDAVIYATAADLLPLKENLTGTDYRTALGQAFELANHFAAMRERMDSRRNRSAPFNGPPPKGKTMTKKTHPHGLPHLADAKNHDDFVSGSAAWAPHVGPGKEYEFTGQGEISVNDTTDILYVVREKKR